MEKINLNFGWKYTPDFNADYLKKDYDDSTFEIVNIPHANKEIPYNNFDEEMYQFVSCYRKNVFIDKNLQGKKLILEFEAVANFAEVYVNGNLAVSHKGSYTSFNCDIADLVNYGEENVIAVMVDSTEREEIPPFGGVVDYLVYGGIYREVYIYVHETVYATGIYATPVDVMSEPKFNIAVKLNREVRDLDVEIAVLDAEGKEVAKELVKTNSDTAGALLKIPNAVLWDTKNPYMYTVIAKFNGETISDKSGLRHCEFKKNGFFLNGELIKIVGLNRHQSYPYVGYAMPKSAQEADAVYLKEVLGVNLVRTSHYPNSKHFLNKCDELGLLVFTEIPGWQFISQIKEWRELCYQHVKEMIIQDYNHPSIIIWGVRINESNDDEELFTETNRIAHMLDSSRQTGGVRCIPQSQLLEDVYTYNDFTNAGGGFVFLPKFIVTKPSTPYLITEHSGHMFPTKTFDHEKKRLEHALRHAQCINLALKRKTTSGCIGWCMSDYNTHKDFGSGDKICYHGVSDMFRIDKLAANVYKSQQDKIPVLEISSNMEIGDTAGGKVGKVYIFTNCDTIKMYKNGVYIGELELESRRKKSKLFKYMKFPPIELDDTIGDQLEKDEIGFSKRDAEKMKKALQAIKEYGTIGGILRHPFALLGNLIKYKLSVTSITLLFGKYVTSWGSKQSSYKFEGCIDGKPVVSVEKGSVFETDLYVAADSTKLVEDETYDVTRIELKAVSQYGNVLPYSNEVVTVETSDNLEVIGPKTIALIGGQRAVWVKTNGKDGKAEVKFTSALGNKTVSIDITKK